MNINSLLNERSPPSTYIYGLHAEIRVHCRGLDVPRQVEQPQCPEPGVWCGKPNLTSCLLHIDRGLQKIACIVYNIHVFIRLYAILFSCHVCVCTLEVDSKVSLCDRRPKRKTSQMGKADLSRRNPGVFGKR